MLQTHANELRNEGKIKGPILNIATMESDESTYGNGLYFSGTYEAEKNLRSRQTFVRETTTEIKGNVATRGKYNHIVRGICIMHVDGVSGITKICAERDDQNRRRCKLPPVLPTSFLSYSK